MNRLRKLVLGAVLFTLLVSLAGCNKNTVNHEDLINDAKTNVSTIKNYDGDMNIDLSLKLIGNDTNLTMKTTVTSFVDPIKMKVSSVVTGAMNQSTEMYAEQNNDKVVTYTKTNDTWSSNETAVSDAKGLDQYTPNKSMKLYLDNFKEYKETGTEVINGTETVKYEGMISGDALSEAVKSSGIANSFSSYAKDLDVNKVIDSALTDTPTTIWIEKESALPVKYAMDMKDVLSKLLNQVMSQATQGITVNINVSKAILDMTLSNINQAGDFTIPQEALDAKQ